MQSFSGDETTCSSKTRPKAADNPTTSKDDLEIAHLINNRNKIVFSKTPQRAEEKKNRKNVKLIREVNPEGINCWKQQGGKYLAVRGNNLAVSLAQNGSVDEFLIMVNPVVLGKGTQLFEGIEERLNLRLVKTRM